MCQTLYKTPETLYFCKRGGFGFITSVLFSSCEYELFQNNVLFLYPYSQEKKTYSLSPVCLLPHLLVPLYLSPLKFPPTHSVHTTLNILTYPVLSHLYAFTSLYAVPGMLLSIFEDSTEAPSHLQGFVYSFFFFFNKFIYLFLAALGLCCCAGFLQLWQAGATLPCSARASHCGGFSLLRSLGSRRASFSCCGTRALECRLSSCGAWAQLLRGMWDLPGPGLKPVSPALAGGFLTTAPPGKSCLSFLVLLPPNQNDSSMKAQNNK